MATKIFSDNGFLNFSSGKPASRDEYEAADRCIGSIFEALEPGERVLLTDGEFQLDEELDLVQA